MKNTPLDDFIIKNSQPWQIGAYYLEIRKGFGTAEFYVRIFCILRIGKKVTIQTGNGIGYLSIKNQNFNFIGPMTEREALYYKAQIEKQLKNASNSIVAILKNE